jgi:hypothetical protein
LILFPNSRPLDPTLPLIEETAVRFEAEQAEDGEKEDEEEEDDDKLLERTAHHVRVLDIETGELTRIEECSGKGKKLYFEGMISPWRFGTGEDPIEIARVSSRLIIDYQSYASWGEDDEKYGKAVCVSSSLLCLPLTRADQQLTKFLLQSLLASCGSIRSSPGTAWTLPLITTPRSLPKPLSPALRRSSLCDSARMRTRSTFAD